MEFYKKEFPGSRVTLYPLGDFHYGSRQCDVEFIKQVIAEIKEDPWAAWCGMGDLMENAIIGSKSDLYTQNIPPEQQIADICQLLEPIKDKGLFIIAGNHERRTHRQVGISLEHTIAVRLGLPYLGFSCLAQFMLWKGKGSEHHTKRSFTCYFHHNYGGGWSPGGKVNRADTLRRIVPTADAIFSGHFHVTDRMPVTWYEAGQSRAVKRSGVNYITGSALTWADSYAEEKGKPPAALEFIKVTFYAPIRGDMDAREQIYEVIPKRRKEER